MRTPLKNIETTNNNLLPIKVLKCFSYLKNILKYDYINEYHLAGGRKSGKTFNLFLWFVLYIYGYFKDKKIKVLIFRKYHKDLESTIIDEMRNIFIDLELEINESKYNNTFYCGDSQISFKAVNQRDKKVKSLSGLANLRRYDLVLVHFEEAWEFDEKDISLIKEAIRGYKDIRYFYSTNPWEIENWYIKYLNTNLQFNKKELKAKGQMLSVVNRKLFHYVNYQVNKQLNPFEIWEFKQMEIHNPIRAEVVCYGMFGHEGGTVYDCSMIKKISKLKKYQHIGIGIDFGIRRDATAVIVSGITDDFSQVDVIWEYYHSNKDLMNPKTVKQMCEEIVKELSTFLKDHFAREWNDIDYSFSVICDNSDPAFMERLDEISFNLVDMKFSVEGINKKEIIDRVNLQQALISENRLGVHIENCGNFWGEIKNVIWDDESKKKGAIVDKDNHTQDAFHYGTILQYESELKDGLSSLYFDKEYNN